MYLLKSIRINYAWDLLLTLSYIFTLSDIIYQGIIFSVLKINIGIIDEDPSTRDGTREIMLKLQKFVPRRKDGTFRVVPCHGDGMAVERMIDAQKVRAADDCDVDRIEGLCPCPQEFHHRGLMLQVLFLESLYKCIIVFLS